MLTKTNDPLPQNLALTEVWSMEFKDKNNQFCQKEFFIRIDSVTFTGSRKDLFDLKNRIESAIKEV